MLNCVNDYHQTPMLSLLILLCYITINLFIDLIALDRIFNHHRSNYVTIVSSIVINDNLTAIQFIILQSIDLLSHS